MSLYENTIYKEIFNKYYKNHLLIEWKTDYKKYLSNPQFAGDLASITSLMISKKDMCGYILSEIKEPVKQQLLEALNVNESGFESFIMRVAATITNYFKSKYEKQLKVLEAKGLDDPYNFITTNNTGQVSFEGFSPESIVKLISHLK